MREFGWPEFGSLWGPGDARPPIDAVVVIGASLMNAMFGKNLVTPHATATALLAAAGHNIPVYGWATPSTYLSAAATHYNEARAAHPNALIISHFGGNNVTDGRPFPGGQANFETGLASFLAAAAGDKRLYPASLSFRDYGDATFQNPALGSKPYNENLVLPWIAANFPHAMAPYGRPKFDHYRIVLQNFEDWLHADNVHLTGSVGYPAMREWMVARMAEVLSRQVPAEIPERVYVPPPSNPISIINFTGLDYGATRYIDYNNVVVNAISIDPNPLPSILDTTGAPTGMSMALAYTGSPLLTTSDPGRGANPDGRVTGLPAYSGQLNCSHVVGASAYMTASVSLVLTFSGMVPLAEYEVRFIASRNTADARYTTVTVAGVPTTFNTSENPAVERGVTVSADAGGQMVVTTAVQAGTAFAYLGGLSIERVGDPPAHPLQAYYDTSTILIHHSTDGATPSGGPATALANLGAAGAAFNATVSGAAMTVTGNYLQASESGGFPILANPADLVGIRLMWVMNPSDVTNLRRLFGRNGTPRSEIRTSVNGSGLQVQVWSNQSGSGVSVNPTGRVPADLRPYLMEIQFNPTNIDFYIDAVLMGTASHSWSAVLVDRIGRADGTSVPYNGGMGDVLGVLLGQGNTAAAITAVRAYLNTRFSLGLSL